ncbi:MAG TPA: lipopolysaccharide biosynthesis protein [Terriglobales bacterium]|nr:lipopolysaccharide biosynthesis protein [Terriglobales bacterium]
MSVHTQPAGETATVRSGLSEPDRTVLAWNGILNNSWPVIASIVGFVVTPVMLRHLGADLFGTWTTMLAFIALAALLDAGVNFIVIRQVASSHDAAVMQGLAGAALAFYLLFGLLGGILIGALGAMGVVAGPERATAVSASAALGALFFGEQLLAFASAVLTGQQRFRALTYVNSAGSLAKGLILLVLSLRGEPFVVLLAWYAVASCVVGFAGSLIALETPRALSPAGLHAGWSLLVKDWRFGLMSRVASVIAAAIWQGPMLVIAAVSGVGSVTAYRVGQRMPFELSSISWRASEVFFPRASQYASERAHGSLREIFALSTRWMLFLTLPAAIALVWLAPELLRAWLGQPPAGSIAVLRITTIAVTLGAIGNGADNLLMGEGRAGPALAVGAGVALVTLGLGGFLLRPWGVPGFAAAGLLAWAFSTGAYLFLETRTHGISWWELGRSAARGLFVPLAAEAGAIALARFFSPETRWLGALLPLAAGLIAYAATVYWTCEQERQLFRQILRGTPKGNRAAELITLSQTSVDEVLHHHSDV